LLATADPTTYFTGNYIITQDLGATIEYQYYNEENGIYKFTNGSLVREKDLDDYSKCVRYSVLVKLGLSNANKQYHLSRLLDGYYPSTSLTQPIEFKEKHNWILRNRVDYNNLFEINYYDVLKHGTQSYNFEGMTYSIPERTIAIGEFGVILNTQEGKSNIIKNKYKVNLRGITQTSKYYWICGDENTLLKVRKHDFFIDRIIVENIPTTLPNIIKSNLSSVSFFDDLNGAVVGELNTILYTKNGGLNWNRIEVSDFTGYNYNKVLYSTNSSFFVAGNTGVLIEFVNTLAGWVAYKRRVSKIEDSVDEYLLVENINDLYKTTLTSWSISYNYYTQSIPTNKELLFLVTNNNNIIAYDINNSFSQVGTDFIYFDFGKNYGDVRNITQKAGTNKFYFTGTDPISGNDGIFSFDISTFNLLGTGSSYSNTTVANTTAVYEYSSYLNKIFDYNGNQMLACGNNSILGISTYPTLSFSTLDSTFNNKLKSKMLFVDYDIASKLNFFTDQGEYRLPTSLTFSTSLTASGSKLEFLPIQHGITSTNNGTYSETNWITYMTDSMKTFEYYSNAPLDESTKVLISTTFSYTSQITSITYSNVNITASASQISYLAPMITYATASRYDGQFLPAITAPPSSSYNIYLYDYLMVYKVPTSYLVSKGDVLLFKSPMVDTHLTVNKIVDIGSWRYIYLYTEFNQNIITDLTKTSGVITVTNLNKYSNMGQLKYRFNNHPISDGYKIEYVDTYGNVTSATTSVFQITPRFNYETAYYNLQYRGLVSAASQNINYNNTYYFNGGATATVATSLNYFGGGHTQNNYPAWSGQLLNMINLPIPGEQVIVKLNNIAQIFTFTAGPSSGLNVNIDTDPFNGIPNTLNNLLNAITTNPTLAPFLYIPLCQVGSLPPSLNWLELWTNPIFGSLPNSNPAWQIVTNPAYPASITWQFAGPSIQFTGGITDPIPTTSATVSATMSSLPLNNDTCLVYVGSTPYTFTFKNSPILSTDVQITGSINSTLIDLKNKILALTGLNAKVSSATVVGNQIQLSAFSTFGSTPNTNWYIRFNLTTSLGSFSYVNATMSIVPSNGDTCVVTVNSTPYTFTFVSPGPAVGSYQVQVGGTINTTLTNLRTKINSSPVLSFLSGSSVNGNQIGLTATPIGPTPNNNWNINFSLNTGSYFTSSIYDAKYTDSFLKFGYSPTYNLMDYLTGINDPNDVNPKFYATKEYLAMPIYNGLPLGSLSTSTVYIDYNGMTYSGGSYSLPVNKILFGSDFKLEWESIFLNTFVDVKIHGISQTYTTEKMLVTDKYYDSINDTYIVEFHKRFNLPLGINILQSGCTLDIISRRHLYQISEDLQELNNIQRTKGKVNKVHPDSSRVNYSYESYENELNYKIPTDSYAKILLSDSDTIQQLSAVIYIDYKNELAMNITRLVKEYNVPIVNTIDYSGKLYISCAQNHDLITGDGVVLDFIGGTGSSQELNPQYSGYHVITKINNTDFVTDINYGVAPTVGLDSGYVRYTKQDPFLNYQPVDLIDLGIDGKGKIAIELSVDNVKLSEGIYSLVDVDFEKYRFRLIDGLNIETVNLQYSWLLEAELSDALIGFNGQLIWYKGTWVYGRWFGGVWQSGVWMAGDWYGGVWNSNIESIWYSGRWFDGTWNGGVWNNGRWYGGTWNNGMWHRGTWNDGTWNEGSFEGGIWVLGTWNKGVFSCKNEPAYWLDGKWYGGDFENGMWYNGYWEQKNKLARFGTKSFNSRTANWQAGIWVSGSFYSYINTNDQGILDVSDVHKYSIWKTGQWLSGEWYGGIAYNMDFKTGTWYGGILEEIEVIGIDAVNNTFILNGIFKFNIGDKIYIIDNELNNSNSVYGSNLSPGEYVVLYQKEDSLNKRTILYVDTKLSTLGSSVTPAVDTGLRVVSRFRNLNWKSGIWTNGIYDSGLWEGGIWYNGVFSGTWT